MKSKWGVSSQYIGGEKEYQVYRLLDIHAVDHSGNREYSGRIYDSKESAQIEADRLNREGHEDE